MVAHPLQFSLSPCGDGEPTHRRLPSRLARARIPTTPKQTPAKRMEVVTAFTKHP